MTDSASPQTLEQLADWPVSHLAAAVRTGDGTWHSVGDTEQVFELASVTKLLAAVGVLVAVEEGVFELDDELSPPGATVRHLLAHAGGVGFDTREPERDPATRRIYSSAGYEIVADAVAEEAEMPFAEYLDLGLFQPLGMTHTRLEGSAGHGGRSSVADLQSFVEEIFHPSLLHPSTLAEATQVNFPGLDGIVPGYGMQRPADWGLGFQIYGRPDSKQGLWFGSHMPAETLGHFGQAGTFLWLHLASGRAAIVLTDEPFGQWAKPLWHDFNDALWTELEQRGDS